MSEVSYLPLIEDMVWSYTRIGAFKDCPYKFFLRYISRIKEDDRFYSSYGSFMHKLIERYYNGDLSKEDMQMEFLLNFSAEVQGDRPKESIVSKYIQRGSEYLRGFEPFPYKMVEVEKKVEFEVGGYKFLGFIDYLGVDENGDYVVIDNKSRDLKPRSKRANPTQKDIELDEMLRQLYLYSIAVKQEYGKYPTKLCFNCFKAGVFIEEPFEEEKLEEAVNWVVETIESIKETEDFYPVLDFFGCKYICGVSHECLYRQEELKEFSKKRWSK